MKKAHRLEASEIGIDTLGELVLYSGWSTGRRFSEVRHLVQADVIYVEPRSILYWDAEPDRQNSMNRFAHILRWRGVAPLADPEDYQISLHFELTSEGLQPPETRLKTLGNLATRYHREAAEGLRITRLATSTARILFNYEPPQGNDLRSLQSYLLDIQSR